MARIRVGAFLEDVAHEQLITALVRRCASVEGVPIQFAEEDVRNSSRGFGAAFAGLERYLRNYANPYYDIVVVIIDGNCKGPKAVRDAIRSRREASGFPGQLVLGVPDPHIERWYVADKSAVEQALNCPVSYTLPKRKCDKEFYKKTVQDIIASANDYTYFAGADLGREIARHMRLEPTSDLDASLRLFLTDLRAALRLGSRTSTPSA